MAVIFPTRVFPLRQAATARCPRRRAVEAMNLDPMNALIKAPNPNRNTEKRRPRPPTGNGIFGDNRVCERSHQCRLREAAILIVVNAIALPGAGGMARSSLGRPAPDGPADCSESSWPPYRTSAPSISRCAISSCFFVLSRLRNVAHAAFKLCRTAAVPVRRVTACRRLDSGP